MHGEGSFPTHKEGRTIVLDGCGTRCAYKILKHLGIAPTLHLVLTDHGANKEYDHLDPMEGDYGKSCPFHRREVGTKAIFDPGPECLVKQSSVRTDELRRKRSSSIISTVRGTCPNALHLLSASLDGAYLFLLPHRGRIVTRPPL